LHVNGTEEVCFLSCSILLRFSPYSDYWK